MTRDGNGEGYIGELGQINADGFPSWSLIENLCQDTCQTDGMGAIQDYNTDQNWHTYRFEVQDNNVRFYIDDAEIRHATDNTYPSGDYVGLSTGGCQLTVSSFKVTTL